MGLRHKIAVAGLTSSVSLFGLAPPAAAGQIVRQDSGEVTTSFTRRGVRVTCTVRGERLVAFDQETSSTLLRLDTQIDGESACFDGFVSGEGSYRRSADGPTETLTFDSNGNTGRAEAQVDGVVTTFEVFHRAIFDCDLRPTFCGATVVTQPK